MSIRKYAVTFLLVLTSSVLVLSAHEAEKHSGKPTMGEIAAVAADGLQMKTAMGTVKVSFNEETKFEHGDQVVDKSHLMKGEKITVFGTKLPSGEIVAKEVVLGAMDMDHPAGKPGAKHDH
jgi:hypothetical protein